MTEKRFGMYQNTLYDNGDILNPFNAMKLLNHFDKENTKLNEENEQLKQREKILEGMIRTFDEGCKEIYDDTCRLEKENEKLKQQRDFYYARLQKIIKVANGDWE